MMRPGAKGGLVVLLTFALGTLVGALGAGTFAQRRLPPPPRGGPNGRPPGFVEEMERLLEPRDEAQRAALRPHLEATDQRNRQIVDGARSSMRVALDSLRAEIVPILTAEQLERFDRFAQRPPPGRGPPGLPR
jgi:uncharacterized membrane protein